MMRNYFLIRTTQESIKELSYFMALQVSRDIGQLGGSWQKKLAFFPHSPGIPSAFPDLILAKLQS
jgi:hypothetical protein